MASEQAEAIKSLLKAMRDATIAQGGPMPTVEEQRALSEAGMSVAGVMPDGIDVTETTVAGGIPALWIEPAGAAEGRVILYLHGGGYVVLSPRSHVRLAGGIAHAAGCKVLSVDYRLAPEHPHPAAVTDALAAYKWLLEQGYPPAHIAIAGDSAGGGLTIATLLAAREAGLPQPAAAVPLSPWVDLEGIGDSMTTKADVDLMVNGAGLKVMADLFVAGGDKHDPLAAPLYGDLRGLAPLYIQVGGDETLLDDSTRIAVLAAHAGVDVRLDVFPEMQHVFQAALGQVPEADDAIARIGAYLRARLT
jgi:acetyl esterase/lipase